MSDTPLYVKSHREKNTSRGFAHRLSHAAQAGGVCLRWKPQVGGGPGASVASLAKWSQWSVGTTCALVRSGMWWG